MIATINDTRGTARLFEGFDAVDFSMLRKKLMDSDEGAGWTESLCDEVETEYRRYLAMSRFYDTRSFVPSQLVDMFWHYHILDTQAYMQDCQTIFGEYFHHFPYFGMRGDQDQQDLADSYDETLKAYERHFGPAPTNIWPNDGMARCPKCGRG